MKKKIIPVILAVLLLALAAAAAAILARVVQKYTPTKERVDGAAYFGLSDVSELALVFQDEILEEKGLFENGYAYLNYEVVKDYLNDRFYWDETESLMLYTTPTEVIKIPAESQSYTAAGAEQTEEYAIVRVSGGQAYIAAGFVQKYTAMDYAVCTAPNRVVVTYKYGEVTTAEVKADAPVRTLGGIKSPIVTELAKGDRVTVLTQLEDWSQVVTADGYIGYIRNRKLTDVGTEELTTDFVEPTYTNIKKDGTVSLVWHQVTSQDANDALEESVSGMTGVNVISPTWFSVSDNSGAISSLGSASYVEKAHALGLDVWGLVDNFGTEVDTTALLSATTSRQALIGNLVSEALSWGLDGINIDFESVPEAAGDAYIEFLRELSVQCRANALVLSVDLPVPMSFNTHYQREQLAEVVDYVIIMGYDEHYSGSEIGTQASYTWACDGVTNTLAAGVPAERIILGVPFYSDLWKTDGDGNVTMQAYGMTSAAALLEENGVTASWDEETGQDYAEFTDSEGNFCQIWLENAASLEKKLSLVSEYALGGCAAWKLGLQTDSIWTLLAETVGG